jgi:hypothetical protein
MNRIVLNQNTVKIGIEYITWLLYSLGGALERQILEV